MIKPERRQEIKRAVLLALQHWSECTLPLKVKALCKSYSNIRLIPFSVHMRHQGLTYKEVLEYCGTSDSCADYYAQHDKYIIYYNDIDKHNIVDSNRYRWNIAHELGHILLNHHKNNGKTRIFRSNLTNSEYYYLEKEADYFAQLLLVPHVVLYAFKIKSASNIKYLCKISDPASKKRFYEYQLWKKNINGNDSYDKPLFFIYYNFIYKKRCRTCNAHLIQAQRKFCPICGQKHTLEWGDGKMIYPKLETDDNGKLLECPICENEEIINDGEYCHICGTYLINKCDDRNYSEDDNNKPCGHILPNNARYCPYCGHTSIFFNDNLLCSWQEYQKQVNTSPELPFDTDEVLPFNTDEELPFA